MKIQVLFGALALAAWFWVASDEAYRVSWEKDRRVVGHRRFNVFFWETSEPLPPGATRRAWQAALAR